MSKLGKRLIDAAKEARSIARGESSRGSRIHVPDDIDVKSMRSRLKLSQDDFAACFGFTAARIRDDGLRAGTGRGRVKTGEEREA